LDVGFSEIQFDAAKNGGDISALKILAGHAALQTAEDDGSFRVSAGSLPEVETVGFEPH